MKITIDEKICTNIELLQYEVNARKEIISAYLHMNNGEPSELFKTYQNEYFECFKKYNLAKQEVTEKYNVPKGVSWNLDFASRELTFEE